MHRTIEGSKEFGIGVSGVSVDFAVSQDRKNAVVGKLYKGLAGLLKGRKVTTLSGTGTLKADHRVEVVDGEDAGRVVVGRNVVLAAGSVPHLLPGFEVDGRLIMTSDEFLDLKELPASVVVIGGGVVGCEFASLLADLGSKVTILEALDTILPGCDDDIIRLLVRSFKKRGIDIVTGVKVEGHTPSQDGTTTTVQGGRPDLRRGGGRGLGGPAPPHRRVGGRRGGRPDGRAAASSWPTSTSAPASTASGPWATSWPARRSWPTSGSPRPSWR